MPIIEDNAARTSFNTTINKELAEAFRKRCKEDGLKMNIILEAIMRQYINGEFEIVLRKKREYYIKDAYKED